MLHLLDFYVTQYRIALLEFFQYRGSAALSMVGRAIEPVVYLAAWQAAAGAAGGEINGYAPEDFAQYFIAGMVVRQAVVSHGVDYLEHRVRDGSLSTMLLHPIHFIHPDTALLMAWKTVELFGVVPAYIGLTLLFRPEFHPTGWMLALSIPALILGFFVRYVLFYGLASVMFWTTRGDSLFRAVHLAELFLAGRIGPLGVFPGWLQTVAQIVPFRLTYAFPLELLLGNVRPLEALAGIGAQVVWIIIFVALLLVGWRAGLRQYSAVGG